MVAAEKCSLFRGWLFNGQFRTEQHENWSSPDRSTTTQRHASAVHGLVQDCTESAHDTLAHVSISPNRSTTTQRYASAVHRLVQDCTEFAHDTLNSACISGVQPQPQPQDLDSPRYQTEASVFSCSFTHPHYERHCSTLFVSQMSDSDILGRYAVSKLFVAIANAVTILRLQVEVQSKAISF